MPRLLKPVADSVPIEPLRMVTTAAVSPPGELRLRIVSARPLSTTERVAWQPSDSEIYAWYGEAAAQGASLVVLRTDTTLDIYSTQTDRQFDSLIHWVAMATSEQARGRSRTLPIQAPTGSELVRHLFGHAAGLGVSVGQASQRLAQIQLTCMMARNAGSLGEQIEQLFRRATIVGMKVQFEAQVAHSGLPSTWRRISKASSQKIVDEAVASWQDEQERLHQPSRIDPVQQTSDPVDQYRHAPGQDAPSGVRIRASKRMAAATQEIELRYAK